MFRVLRKYSQLISPDFTFLPVNKQSLLFTYCFFAACMQECIVCGEDDRHMFKGTRYQCHEDTGAEEQVEHDRMCYDCARASYDNPECPIHHMSAHEDHNIIDIEAAYVE